MKSVTASPGRRQAVERAHRHVELRSRRRRHRPAPAADACRRACRSAGRSSSRRRFTEVLRYSAQPAPCAWQMAQASASAASAAGSPGSASRRFTMCCTCSFAAWPLPTTACFTCSAVYSATGRPASTAAQIAVPRAWPSASVDCGLTLTNTFSTATSAGRVLGDHVVQPFEDRLQPRGELARAGSDAAARRRKRSLLPLCSMTPNPVMRRPGSMPRILQSSTAVV